MLWKIFFGVWLCCWKYHRKHIFYLLLTFSHIFLAAKQIYNFIPQSRNTNKTQKKKFIIRLQLGLTRGEIARQRRRRDRAARCCDHDRGRRSRSRAIDFAVRRERLVLGGSVLGCDDLAGGAISATNELGLGFSGFIGVGFWVRRSRALLGFLGSSSLSLSLCARALLPLSLSLSSLSVFRKIVFEGKIKTEINLHPITGQLKCISGKCIFHAQPNTCKYGKAFTEVIFTQNKHSLSGHYLTFLYLWSHLFSWISGCT